MLIRSITSEALRNLTSGTTRATLLATVFAVLVGALAVVDVRAVISVLQGADDYRTSGAAVQVVEVLDGVDGHRCAALTDATGVVAAGALRRGEPLRALAMPSSQLDVWEVTPGVLDVIADTGTDLRPHTDPTTGLWFSGDLAETLGAHPGSVVPTAAGPATTAGTYQWPDDGRGRTLGYTVVAPVTPHGVFDQCWAQIWPQDEDAAALLRTTIDPSRVENATMSKLNSSFGASYDTATLLDRRPTEYAPVGAAVIGLVLGYGAVRLRRLEVAGALHARIRKPTLAWQHAVEAIAWSAAGLAVAGAVAAIAAGLHNPDPGPFALLVGARTLLAGAAAVLLGTVTAVLTTREKHLFRYFKDR